LDEKISTRQRLRYWFDSTMSRGTSALIGWLGLLSLILVIIFVAILLAVTLFSPVQLPNGLDMSPVNAFWVTFLHAFNSGQLGNDSGVEWPFLVTMFGVTLGGVFIISSLIGVLTNGLNTRLDELRRGRSRVLESGHTVILGWSDRVFTIVQQLQAAARAEDRANSCIVIMGSQDKVEMEEALRLKVGDTGKTRIICRSGDPIDPDDLRIVNTRGARAVIVITPDSDEPDAEVIKTVLALSKLQGPRAAGYHSVAEIQDEENLETARLVGGTAAQFILVADTASRLIAQTCRQSGLSLVYNTLLDFSGDAIYLVDEPSLVGKPFAEALFAFESASVIGLQGLSGQVKLNPPANTTLKPGEKLAVICANESAARISSKDNTARRTSAAGSISTVSATETTSPPESFLILGWNHAGVDVIQQLENYVAPGSRITVASDAPHCTEDIAKGCGHLQNIQITTQKSNTTKRANLVKLNPAAYQHVIVLGYSDTLDPHHADSRTLMTLLHLRDIKAKAEATFSITSEIADERNRELAEVAEVDDFIVSGKLFSLLMAQMAEDEFIEAVYSDLLTPRGSEIYLRPAGAYINTGTPLQFYDVISAALDRGEVAIGYRRQSDAYSAERSYGVVLNPAKSQQITFDAGDRVIVLAES
jgi:voltage-gated potassium channel Kch